MDAVVGVAVGVATALFAVAADGGVAPLVAGQNDNDGADAGDVSKLVGEVPAMN